MKNSLGRFINYSGKLLEAALPAITASNRSLRYGDGLFESMRWEHGELSLAGFHFERLFHGLGVLQMEWTEDFNAGYLKDQIAELCIMNNQETARIRLNVFRTESPALFPVNNRLQFIIETADLPDPKPEPLRVGIYAEEKKSTGILSNLKTNNYLIYIMAAKHAHQNGFDDALVLNSADRLCEATSSNVFFIMGRNIYTPPLSEGCVAGVMRRHLLNRLPEQGFSVNEIPITKEMIMDMDEGFLTNAIREIRPVSRIVNREFPQKLTSAIIASLAKERS